MHTHTHTHTHTPPLCRRHAMHTCFFALVKLVITYMITHMSTPRQQSNTVLLGIHRGTPLSMLCQRSTHCKFAMPLQIGPLFCNDTLSCHITLHCTSAPCFAMILCHVTLHCTFAMPMPCVTQLPCVFYFMTCVTGERLATCICRTTTDDERHMMCPKCTGVSRAENGHQTYFL